MENLENIEQKTPHPMRRKDDRVFDKGVDIKGISEEDKQEIYENIDRVVENNRIPITKELLTLKPKKRGAAFPVTINILAIVSVAAAFFLSNMFFEQRQEALSLETESYLSAEGKLIEQLKKESEEKLRAKDDEIGRIQEELAELDQKSADLQANMESTIRNREIELRNELQAALETERARLQQTGASSEDIETRLAEFEAERQKEFEAEINTFRSEAEAEIRAKEQELEQAKALNRDFLAQMNAERAELQADLDQREAEMSARFEAEKAALEEETSEAQRRLADLAAKSENEQLIRDQITSGYIAIKEHIDREDFSTALEGISALESLLTDPSVTSISSLTKRIEAERFILETLRQDIEARTYREEVDTASMVRAAETLLAASEIAQRGAEAYESGDIATAADYYSRAIQSIPAISKAYTDLNTITNDRKTRALSAGITGGTELLQAGNTAGALQRFRETVLSADSENAALYSQAVQGIEDSMTRQRSSALAVKDREIRDLTNTQREELEKTRTELESQIASLNETIEELNTRIREQEEALLTSEEALAAAEEEMAAARNEYESRTTDMETLSEEELAEKNAEIERLSSEHEEALTAEEARLLGVQEEYTEALAARDAEIEEMKRLHEEELAAYEERISAVAAEIKAAGEEIAGLRAVKTVYEELTRDYLTYKSDIENILSTGKEDGNGAGSLFSQFLKDDAQTIFPGIASLTDKVYDLKTGDAQKAAAAAGRVGALRDVRMYTDYMAVVLAGGEGSTKETIAHLAADETEYNETILEIQGLVETASAAAAIKEEALIRQSRFIGTISYIIGNKIVIERLISFEAEVGDKILVKRKTPGGEDEILAEAAVSRITPQKVEAMIDSYAGGSKPQVMDLVYLVTD